MSGIFAAVAGWVVGQNNQDDDSRRSRYDQFTQTAKGEVMKIVYADVKIEVLAEEDLINGPLELQLSDDVVSFMEDLDGWLRTLDEYPNFRIQVSTH